LANPRGGWYSRRTEKEIPLPQTLSTYVNIASSGLPSSRQASKAPSKQRYDRERTIKRDRIFQERRQERLRLFGYVLLTNGEVLSIDDAVARLRDGLRAEENPNTVGGITSSDIDTWHQPESVRDVIDSIGEVDAVAHYPALGIFPGVVLVDPKLRHRDPALGRV
jgi:hypothetical protein